MIQGELRFRPEGSVLARHALGHHDARRHPAIADPDFVGHLVEPALQATYGAVQAAIAGGGLRHPAADLTERVGEGADFVPGELLGALEHDLVVRILRFEQVFAELIDLGQFRLRRCFVFGSGSAVLLVGAAGGIGRVSGFGRKSV